MYRTIADDLRAGKFDPIVVEAVVEIISRSESKLLQAIELDTIKNTSTIAT